MPRTATGADKITREDRVLMLALLREYFKAKVRRTYHEFKAAEHLEQAERLRREMELIAPGEIGKKFGVGKSYVHTMLYHARQKDPKNYGGAGRT